MKLNPKTTYKYASITIFALAFGYFFFSSHILGARDTIFHNFSFLYGKPSLEIPGQLLSITPNSRYKIIKIRFDRELIDVNVYQEGDSFKVSTIESLWKHIENTNKNDSPSEISIPLTEKSSRFSTTQYSIEEINIDGDKVELEDFYDNRLEKSNLQISYPGQLKKLPATLADPFGRWFSNIITATLLTLFFYQLTVTIFLSWVDDEKTKNYFLDMHDSTNFVIDKICSEYSIPIGFLGTVTSIWISLELGGIQFSNFSGFLEILKIAVFNSAIGLSIKLLCVVRGLLTTNMIKNKLINKKKITP